MKVTVYPSVPSACDFTLPSSKSQTHRALIASALADGVSRLAKITRSEDIDATMDVLKALGACFEIDQDSVIVRGSGRKRDSSIKEIFCHESGSTLRFTIPLFALDETETVFTGKGRLMKRPMDVYAGIFEERNLKWVQTESAITLKGPLTPSDYHVKGNISSQFISGLLFALPLLGGDSSVIVEPPMESASYIALTMDMLKKAGIEIEQNGLTFEIRGNQKYHPLNLTIQGDDSQAAFIASLAALTSSSVSVHRMAHDSLHSDHVIVELMKQSGVSVSETNDGYLFAGNGKPKALEADLSDCPDLGPMLFGLAAALQGKSIFTGTQRLRLKESDRIEAMKEELHKLGCEVNVQEGTVEIEGLETIRGGVTLNGRNDHRIVMALSILACAAEQPVVIEGAEAVRKSWPSFFEDLKNLGIRIEYEE